MKIDEVIKKYGVDPASVPGSTYMINERSGMLSISTKSKTTFSSVKPIDEIYGSFSDSYYYYFTPLKEDKQ